MSDVRTVMVELPVATASVLLEILLTDKRNDQERADLFTRAWHRDTTIDELKDALLDWPEPRRASPSTASSPDV